jgi:hypothetical protein
MPLIPSKLNFLPEFEGRERLYSSILPETRGGLPKIRILTVLPNDDHLAPIEASLSKTPLFHFLADGSLAEYNAVSYYWGDIDELEIVRLNGSDEGEPGIVYEVPVTQHLTAALRQFRSYASKNQEPLQLWVDALCINQLDARERQSQVHKMSLIFQAAKRVWIWLGESDEMVERGLITLAELSRKPPDQIDASSILSPDEEVLRIKQLAAVCALPYWRRGWTFQENMFGLRHLCYGKLRIEFNCWCLTLSTCVLYIAALVDKLGVISWYRSVGSLTSMSKFREDMRQLSVTFAPFAFAEEFSIKVIVDHIKKRPSADDKLDYIHLDLPGDFYSHFFQRTFYRTRNPQDAVFALREIIPALAGVELNYESTPEHTFTVATESLLRNIHGGLRSLPQWFHPQASPQLPSWVFDFTHCNNRINENGHEAFLSLYAIQKSDASAGSSFRVVHCDEKSMHVAGFIFDEILDVSRSFDHTIRPALAFETLLLSWVELAKVHCQASEVSRRGLATYTRAVIRTFGFDPRVKDFTLDELGSPDLIQWEDGPMEVLRAIHERCGILETAGKFGERVVGLHRFIKRHVEQGRFFVTKSLRMGLAPLDAAIGDRIAILASGDAPFVLRPVPVEYAGEEAYRIIGGCYVDGTVTPH